LAYAHSFSADFYGDAYYGEYEHRSRRPVDLSEAIFSMTKREYRKLCRRKFNGFEAGVEDIMLMAIETDTVSNFDSPVEVWIDPDGDFRVLVYDWEEED